MNKLLQHKFWWLCFVLLFAIVIIVSSTLFRYRIDLTAEKRFSLNRIYQKIIENIDSTINIKVFLTGDLPADYKKLSIATQDLLREFSDTSVITIFKFILKRPEKFKR